MPAVSQIERIETLLRASRMGIPRLMLNANALAPTVRKAVYKVRMRSNSARLLISDENLLIDTRPSGQCWRRPCFRTQGTVVQFASDKKRRSFRGRRFVLGNELGQL